MKIRHYFLLYTQIISMHYSATRATYYVCI